MREGMMSTGSCTYEDIAVTCVLVLVGGDVTAVDELYRLLRP